MRCSNLSRSDIVRLTFEGISLAALWTGQGMGTDTQQLVRLLEQRRRERLVGWGSGWAVSLTLFLTFQKLHNIRCRRLNDILSPQQTKTCSWDFPCNTVFWGLRERTHVYITVKLSDNSFTFSIVIATSRGCNFIAVRLFVLCMLFVLDYMFHGNKRIKVTTVTRFSTVPDTAVPQIVMCSWMCDSERENTTEKDTEYIL